MGRERSVYANFSEYTWYVMKFLMVKREHLSRLSHLQDTLAPLTPSTVRQ